MTNNRPLQATERNSAIDLLRGLVMIIMVLDHARDFWTGITPDPTNLDTTSASLFFTRWITHLCAPVFVFLAGTSAYLYGSRRSSGQLSWFLLSRGLWLVFIEFTLCKYVWIPEPGYSAVLLQVIWAIGWSMVALSALCFLGVTAVGAIGLVIVAGHNLLDGVTPADLGSLAPLWTVLHEGGMLQITDSLLWVVAYPLLPWIGVMALGYCFGVTVTLPTTQRQTLYFRTGLLLIGLFLALRAGNFYGDPAPWSAQDTPGFTVLSFLNTTKYPPSLQYLLMTLGPALCLLAWFESWSRGPVFNALLTFGRVPLFFYVLHLYLLRFTALPVSVARFGEEAASPPPGPAGSAMLGLWVTYLAWILAIAILYPACRWFAGVKARRKDWWLSYL